MDYRTAAEARKSTRNFTDKPVSTEHREALKTYFAECKRLVPNIRVEFMIVEGSKRQFFEGNAGYEGLAFDAPSYLLLLSERKPGYLENAGYMSEDVILRMTELGLDNCWLTVGDDQQLKTSLEIQSDLSVAAIIAFGHGKKEKNLKRIHIKSMSNVDLIQRKGYLAPKISINEMVYGDRWGKDADLGENYIDEGLRNALYAASYAPTFLNRQSFRFILVDQKAILIKMMDSLTGEMDARLNCGGVMLNFAAVLDERRPTPTKWILGSVEGVEVPTGCDVIGYCNL